MGERERVLSQQILETKDIQQGCGGAGVDDTAVLPYFGTLQFVKKEDNKTMMASKC